MVKAIIKNWDNKTWLSSQNYINSFNIHYIKCSDLLYKYLKKNIIKQIDEMLLNGEIEIID